MPARNKTRRGYRAAIAGAMVLLTPLIPLSPVAADDSVEQVTEYDPQSTDNLSPALKATMQQQESLQPAVSLIMDQAVASPDSGFAGLAFEGDGLSIYWKGNLDAGMQQAVTDARKFGAVGVKAALHSKAELEAAADEVERAMPAGATDVQAIGVRHDGSGLTIERMPATESASLRSSASRFGRSFQTADETLKQLNLDVPVQVTTASRRSKLLSCVGACDRLDDASPWNGGTRTITPDAPKSDYGCTTGFGVTKGSTTYVLTAAHCATSGNHVTDYQGETIGGVYAENWQYDLLLLNARGWYKIFDGSTTTANKKDVVAWGYHSVGEYLCHSGSRSGTKCGLRTESGNYRVHGCDSDGDCFYVEGLIKTVQVDGATAAINGDSGGPVFSLSGSGVRAKGIVSAGGGTEMYFQDWADVIRLYGAYPRTP
ncbi:hypothetical protein AB0L86_24985 [Micromonospora musae]|uniref:hypothetical protein n=1 Tax=Micromonospora musae TaxID=1894970 RepID=UPI0034245051